MYNIGFRSSRWAALAQPGAEQEHARQHWRRVEERLFVVGGVCTEHGAGEQRNDGGDPLVAHQPLHLTTTIMPNIVTNRLSLTILQVCDPVRENMSKLLGDDGHQQ